MGRIELWSTAGMGEMELFKTTYQYMLVTGSH